MIRQNQLYSDILYKRTLKTITVAAPVITHWRYSEQTYTIDNYTDYRRHRQFEYKSSRTRQIHQWYIEKKNQAYVIEQKYWRFWVIIVRKILHKQRIWTKKGTIENACVGCCYRSIWMSRQNMIAMNADVCVRVLVPVRVRVHVRVRRCLYGDPTHFDSTDLFCMFA